MHPDTSPRFRYGVASHEARFVGRSHRVRKSISFIGTVLLMSSAVTLLEFTLHRIHGSPRGSFPIFFALTVALIGLGIATWQVAWLILALLARVPGAPSKLRQFAGELVDSYGPTAAKRLLRAGAGSLLAGGLVVSGAQADSGQSLWPTADGETASTELAGRAPDTAPPLDLWEPVTDAGVGSAQPNPDQDAPTSAEPDPSPPASPQPGGNVPTGEDPTAVPGTGKQDSKGPGFDHKQTSTTGHAPVRTAAAVPSGPGVDGARATSVARTGTAIQMNQRGFAVLTEDTRTTLGNHLLQSSGNNSTVQSADPNALSADTQGRAQKKTNKTLTKKATSMQLTVQKGDSLWFIAKQNMVPAGATNAQIDEAWRVLYSANVGAIGDNPDLIHPGLLLDVPNLPA